MVPWIWDWWDNAMDKSACYHAQGPEFKTQAPIWLKEIADSSKLSSDLHNVLWQKKKKNQKTKHV